MRLLITRWTPRAARAMAMPAKVDPHRYNGGSFGDAVYCMPLCPQAAVDHTVSNPWSTLDSVMMPIGSPV